MESYALLGLKGQGINPFKIILLLQNKNKLIYIYYTNVSLYYDMTIMFSYV